jgi:hypothetical protein
MTVNLEAYILKLFLEQTYHIFKNLRPLLGIQLYNSRFVVHFGNTIGNDDESIPTLTNEISSNYNSARNAFFLLTKPYYCILKND